MLPIELDARFNAATEIPVLARLERHAGSFSTP